MRGPCGAARRLEYLDHLQKQHLITRTRHAFDRALQVSTLPAAGSLCRGAGWITPSNPLHRRRFPSPSTTASGPPTSSGSSPWAFGRLRSASTAATSSSSPTRARSLSSSYYILPPRPRPTPRPPRSHRCPGALTRLASRPARPPSAIARPPRSWSRSSTTTPSSPRAAPRGTASGCGCATWSPSTRPKCPPSTWGPSSAAA